MKRGTSRVLFVLAGLTVSATSLATPLRLDYAVTPSGPGVWTYNFTLTLDNHDSTWVNGHGFGWLVFGDVPTGTSNLTGWVGNTSSFVGGPWNGFGGTTGGHNGPDLQPVLNYWTPTAVGQTVQWSGTSTADLADGQLRFSNVVVQGGAIGANFELAHRTAVPEPASMAALGLGALALIRRRRSR